MLRQSWRLCLDPFPQHVGHDRHRQRRCRLRRGLPVSRPRLQTGHTRRCMFNPSVRGAASVEGIAVRHFGQE